MRAHYLLLLCLGCLAGFASCDFRSSSSSSPSSAFRRATGWPFEVVVVMDKSAWKAEAGQLLNEQLEEPVAGLSQSEPAMRVTYVDPSDFTGLLKYVRNILIVTVDTERYTRAGFKAESDRWSAGQGVVYLYAPTTAALTEYLLMNEGKLVSHFSKMERDRWVAGYGKSHSSWVNKRLKERFGVSLFVPEDMMACKDTTDFLWVSNNANRGRMDLLAYSFPYATKEAFTRDYLIAARDSVLKSYVPGSFPGSYMTTEKRFGGPSYEPITYQDEYCGVLRGLWRVQGDMMGGPFVSHAFLDKSRQRVIVLEGFVYAPESKKANLMRRLEASLYTSRLASE